MSTHEERRARNAEFRCARTACQVSLLNEAEKILAGQHRHDGHLYCRTCTREINDMNRPYRRGKDTVLWVWSCAVEGCDTIVDAHLGLCWDHGPNRLSYSDGWRAPMKLAGFRNLDELEAYLMHREKEFGVTNPGPILDPHSEWHEGYDDTEYTIVSGPVLSGREGKDSQYVVELEPALYDQWWALEDY